MLTTQEKIYKAYKIYNSCQNKFYNILPWVDSIPERILTSIEFLKQVVNDYKIDKNINFQIKYLQEIDIFYDEYFKRISDNYELSNHVGILKDLIVLCTRVYREDINVQSLIKKFIEQSERTCQEHLIDRAYRFVIDFYKNPTDEQVTLLKDIYEKLHAIRGTYDEKYVELIVTRMNDFIAGAEMYEKIAESRNDNALKFTIDLILMKSFLCYLCVDDVTAERKLNDFSMYFPIITHTSNYKFCVNIMDTYREKNVDEFTLIVNRYNELRPFDDYLVMLLGKIKKQMQEENIDLR